MSTMQELLTRLAEREKARFAAEQEANSRLRAAEAGTSQAAQGLMELRRAQDQEARVIRAQYEKRLRDSAQGQQQKLLKARAEQTKAEAMAEHAERRQKGAETCARALREKVLRLREFADERLQRAKASVASMNRVMDTRLQRVASQNDARIKNMVQHAKDVHAASTSAIRLTTGEVHAQASRSHIRAEGRLRFKELCTLAGNYTNPDLSKGAYFQVKHELINLWHAQKGSTAVQPVKSIPSPMPALEAGPQVPAALGDTPPRLASP